MKFDVILFFVFFGVSTAASALSSFLLFAMVGEINRKKGELSQIPYFRFAWTKVWRDYRTLYPEGAYSRVLAITVAVTIVFGLASILYLFGVLPKYSLPSH